MLNSIKVRGYFLVFWLLKGEPGEIDWYYLLCQERPELGF